ncbi:hypothetical protein TVAG_287340 [Trichomonas vaginalis G3]|uniref:Right handed beta helix domain-containing protein n=1 Tax=Trichomonas vaginalis (strain ATCC PRA-98 / G3) TaxID=412133 RepID=A2G194_TRIV3|nr:pectin lyase-like family [Trichomonas vaginalis G3]EAX89072.1 hypothetical protein TVAG_287340 [Trichomonas vaginalis G3]KAI5518573.1 pectin lyase-like family [Trichomonas vaginalis G3]|eukprot:XP_001302002.1 hypothetical protein [Trichomonas vaginalis G3]
MSLFIIFKLSIFTKFYTFLTSIVNPEYSYWPFGNNTVTLINRYNAPPIQNTFVSEIYLHSCSFLENRNFRHTSACIFTFNCSVYIENCQFYRNSAYYSGVANFAISTKVDIKNSLFASNTADNVGAFSAGCLEAGQIVNITGTNFTKNRAKTWGACLHLDQSSGYIKDLIFFQNSAPDTGSIADYALAPAKRNYNQITFINNTVGNNSAAFNSIVHNFIGEISNSIFVNNVNKNMKGASVAILGDDSSFKIIDCQFDQKQEDLLYIQWTEYTQVEFSNTTTYNCTFDYTDISKEIKIAVDSIFP